MEDGGVVIHEIIEGMAAHGKARHRLAPVEALAAVVRRAAPEQLHGRVGHGLGVNTQAPLVLELGGQGVDGTPKAELDGGPVLHQLRHHPAKLAVHLIGGWGERAAG